VSDEKFSGKFVLRLPKSLHRKLARNAKKENVSLNQYAVLLLSERNIQRHPELA
jgi:antitoxin HicB